MGGCRPELRRSSAGDPGTGQGREQGDRNAEKRGGPGRTDCCPVADTNNISCRAAVDLVRAG
eukprot:3099775-Rhodomonas_salina.1